MTRWLLLLFLMLTLWTASGAQDVEDLKDNSFLIEEAYNQEPGKVQHIVMPELDANNFDGLEQRHQVELSQEWPLGGKRLQISYTIPIGSSDGSDWNVQEMVLSARYQVSEEPAQPYSFAPRLSLIWQKNPLENSFLSHPTVGVGVLLPVSKTLSRRWALHTNVGTTYLPNPYDGLDWQHLPAGRFGGTLPQDRWVHRLGTGLVFAAAKRLDLIFETIGQIEQRVANERFGADTNPALILNPAARTGLQLSRNTDLVVGIGFPVVFQEGSPPDYRVLLYTSLQNSFGGKR